MLAADRPVDMSRPVPAAPSPGASFKRARMTPEAKKHLVDELNQPKEPKPAPTYRYRFMESGAEWAVTEAGHHVVLSCGDLVPGRAVRIRLPGARQRRGILQALLPGWGPSPRPVIAVVQFEFVYRDQDQLRRSHCVRHYLAEQLEVAK